MLVFDLENLKILTVEGMSVNLIAAITIPIHKKTPLKLTEGLILIISEDVT